MNTRGKVRIDELVCHAEDGVAAYDDFAWFYNRYWSEDFHSLAFPILERIWLNRLPGRARVLDVCCGTGHLAALLCERGCAITGLDLSREMIRYARENAPAAQFEVGDVARHKIAGSYDAAISTFDSLNHILELSDLTAAFGNVASALKPEGLFAFDMLLEEAYQTHWGESFVLVRDDHVLTISGAGYDFRSRLACCTITMFRLIGGVWQRSDIIVHERCYSPDEITAALAGAGFGEILCYDARDLGMGGELGHGRTFFVARKL